MMKGLLGTILIVSIVQASNLTEPKIPKKPYDITYMWADYGFVFENYPEIRKTNLTDAKMHNAVTAFIAPIKEYKNFTTSKGISDKKLKDTVIALLDQFSTSESFDKDEVSADDWDSSTMAIKRGTISKAKKARNELFAAIKDNSTHDEAIEQYQMNLQKYRDTVQGIDEKEFRTMFTKKTIKWSKFEGHYRELLKVVQKNATDNANIVRGYFALWLKDGEQNDDVYESLRKRAEIRKRDQIKKIFKGNMTSDATEVVPYFGLTFFGFLAYLLF